MRTVLKWANKAKDEEAFAATVHCVCFSPDGNQLIVGGGNCVIVYDPSDGSVVRLLRGHKDTVYCLDYAADSKRFASGGLDKVVIIWSNKLEGILKYSHSESIQCLAYNPITHQLASCALSDLAFWSTEVKAVQKHRLGSGRVTTCSWSTDGQFLAVGFANGSVSIRNKTGEEQSKITRHDHPIWAILWSESTLLVSDWSETLSFYNSSGQQVLKDRRIGLMPVCLSKLGELILASGAGGWAVLTSEGVPIIHQNQDQWIWSIKAGLDNTIVYGCQNGNLFNYQVLFSTVHGMYHDRYAYREHLTDVIIQQLTSGAKVRIKCHDRVQKIALHKKRLAVQLPERVVIYEQSDTDGMLYRVKDKISQKSECSLLIVTDSSLLLCQDTKLLLIDGRGPSNWQFTASIRYVKVTYLNHKEVLLLGLSNGQICKVELGSPTVEIILNTPAAVRCFDLNSTKNTIAVVDENSFCRVYSIATEALLYTEENVSAVSWHLSFEDLLALSGGGIVCIKVGQFPASSHPLLGAVVGFQSNNVFCLQSNAMKTISVPLSHALHQYLKNQMFNEAYSIACLGVTTCDWETLGFAALEQLSLDVARKAFQRSENIMYLHIIDLVQDILKSGDRGSESLAMAEIFAHRGRYLEAAKLFHSTGNDNKALNMYTDLKMFHKAQEYIGLGDNAGLVRKKAEWARHINEPRAAAEMFLATGDIKNATDIMAENNWVDMLIETGRNLDKGSSESLKIVAEALNSIGQLDAAAELYERLGNIQAVINMAVKAENWQRAFQLVKQYPEYKKDVYIPYAHLMARENQFIEAQKAYHLGGETESAEKVLLVLINNATIEKRFNDAAYLHWLLATQCLDLASSSTDESYSEKMIENYYDNDELASIYHAYDCVYQSIYEPFSLCQPETLFNAAKFSLALLQKRISTPKGISLFCIYLCLAKQGKTLGANKLARQMLDKIQDLKIPSRFQESVEVLTLLSWAASYNDSNEVTPVCYRCSRHLSALTTICHNCGHSLFYSSLTFEILPLVALKPEDDIPMNEVFQLIETVPSSIIDATETSLTDGVEVMQITSSEIDDPVINKPYESDEKGKIVCNREDLKSLHPASIVIVKRSLPLQPLFYRNIMPDLNVQVCVHCFRFFYIDDIELQYISKGFCAFCRSVPDENSREEILLSPKLSSRSTEHSISL